MSARVKGCAAGLAGLMTIVSLGCVSVEKRDVDAARERLDECTAEHGREHPECGEAELTLRDAQERYEQKARERWVCDPTQDPCPTPR